MAPAHPTEPPDRVMASKVVLDGASERELRALVRVAAATTGALRFEEVLEVAANEAQAVLGGASASISRWDRPSRRLQTLINVGELSPGEERWPAGEFYSLADYPRAFELLERGRPYRTELGDPGADPDEARLLRELGKHASLAVPIVNDGRTWGELYITRGGSERFHAHEVEFVGAVADQLALAVVRAESYDRISRLALEDPLTGLANRRAFDERLTATMESALWRGVDVTLVLSDLDGLKAINDTEGHPAGDRCLVATARALEEVVGRRPGALAARIGGDEFALLLDDTGTADGERAALELQSALSAAVPSASVSSGVAARSMGARGASGLIRLADAAQYQAKRTGRGRVSTAVLGVAAAPVGAAARRGPQERRASPREQLVAVTVERLDGELAAAPVLARVEAVVSTWTRTAGAAGWSISRLRDDAVLETLLASQQRTNPRQFAPQGNEYPLADFPQMAALLATGGTMVVRADDATIDPAERKILTETDRHLMLSVAVLASEPLLVELYADHVDAPFATVAPFLRTLLAFAVGCAVVPDR